MLLQVRLCALALVLLTVVPFWYARIMWLLFERFDCRVFWSSCCHCCDMCCVAQVVELVASLDCNKYACCQPFPMRGIFNLSLLVRFVWRSYEWQVSTRRMHYHKWPVSCREDLLRNSTEVHTPTARLRFPA